MLQRVEAEIGEVRGFGMAKDAKDPTVVVEMIVAQIRQVDHAFASLNLSLTPGSHNQTRQSIPHGARHGAKSPDREIALGAPSMRQAPRVLEGPLTASARRFQERSSCCYCPHERAGPGVTTRRHGELDNR